MHIALRHVAGLIALCAFVIAPLSPARSHPQPPAITEYMAEPAILVVSTTRGWRHNEGIAAADLFFAEIASQRGHGLFTTENPAVFNARDLARFDVIVFNNVTGPALSSDQQAAFENWLRQGGAWIGLHAAGDASMDNWPWYQENLIGTRFIGHTMGPQVQEARLVSLALDHPVLAGLPPHWASRDEWYSFDRIPAMPGVERLIGIDETSYSPRNHGVDRWPEDLAMSDAPAGHPMIWAICREDATDRYRGVYSALGHTHDIYRDALYRRLLTQAFDWVSRRGSCDDDSASDQ